MKQEDKKYPQRVRFSRGEQSKFIVRVLQKLEVNAAQLGKIVGVHARSISDWKHEKCSVSLPALKLICHKLGMPLPTGVKIKDPFWYTSLGSRKGWQVIKKKYGRVPIDEKYRKQKWREWWELKGKHTPHPSIGVIKPIKKPQFSKELAEFTGIMIGDGGITKYQTTISMHSKVDKEYAAFVTKLIDELFAVPVKRFQRNFNGIDLIVSRIELVRFCHEELKLPIGNKLEQNLDIPAWIMKKRELIKSCLRGLVDTDGGVFYERHSIKKKVYSYPRLSFVTFSPLLAQSAFRIFEDLGFSPRFRRNGKAVQLEKVSEIRQYFQVVGTHNPKHLKRFLAG